MTHQHAIRRSLVGAAILGLALAAPVRAELSASQAESSGAEAADTAVRTGSPTSVVGTRNLYTFSQRPYARVPAGAVVKVSAPGMTAADLHGHAEKGALFGADARSPLTVPGARLEVKRTGSHYELHITSADRSEALEIQRRAAALR